MYIHVRANLPALVLSLVLIILPANAKADSNHKIAFLSQGAFLITVKNSEQDRFPVIGYLPVGTICIYDLSKTFQLEHADSERIEDYIFINSYEGPSGYVLRRILVDVKGKVLIPVTNRPVPIFSLESTATNKQKICDVHSTDGVYPTVTQTEDPTFFIVNVPKELSKTSSALAGKISKKRIKDGDIMLLSEDAPSIHLLKFKDPTIDENQEDFFMRLASKLQNKLNGEFDKNKIQAFLVGLDRIKCSLSIGSEASMGFKVFGAGLGLNVRANMKNDNMFIEMSEIALCPGDQDCLRFTSLKMVTCLDNNPYKLTHLSLQDTNLTHHPITLWANDLKQLDLDINPSCKGQRATRCMVQITGYKDYIKVYSYLEEQLECNPEYSRSWSNQEKKALLHMLLNQICYCPPSRLRKIEN